MNPDLDKLIRLQRAENDLRGTEAQLAELPAQRTDLESLLAGERKKLETVREGLGLTQKTRRALESELQDLETKCHKYKGQLMEVKTNKEYTAMLHEIEAVERDIREREDQILAEMEKAESLSADLKREEQAFKTEEERHRGEVARLEARAREVEQTRDRLRAERDAVASTLPPPALDLFHRVARLRGVAVAEARDGMCQVCHLKLRLQMYADLKHNEEIVQCPACNRILFYEPPAPEVSAGP